MKLYENLLDGQASAVSSLLKTKGNFHGFELSEHPGEDGKEFVIRVKYAND